MRGGGLAPARADLERASLLAGLWCALLAPAFDRNTPGVDLLLFAIYAALHGLVAGLACFGLRLAWRRLLNWWATYPAEPIDGIVISNRAIPWSGFGPEALAGLDHTSHLVSPEGLLPRVRRSVRQAVEERDASGLRGQTFRYFELRDEIAL